MATQRPSQAMFLLPNKTHDLPAAIVLAVIYFACGIGMIVRFRQSHFTFRMGIFLIAFCMSRGATFAIRSAWASYSTNRNLAIAATVFINAGVVLLVIANMQLYFRLCKSLRPELHKNKALNRVMIGVQAFIIPVLIMTIVPAIQNILTSDSYTQSRDRIVIKISQTYIAIYACLPALLTPLSYLLLKSSASSIARRVVWRVIVITYASTLLGLEMSLRCANTYVPRELARWYGTRWGFYIFTPMLELLIVIPYLLINLPFAFGDSNASVLHAINRDMDDKIEVKGESEEVTKALKATTTTWKPQIWTRI